MLLQDNGFKVNKNKENIASLFFLCIRFGETKIFVLLQRRNGRVVDCGGLENR
jgi:hypothetical protein